MFQVTPLKSSGSNVLSPITHRPVVTSYLSDEAEARSEAARMFHDYPHAHLVEIARFNYEKPVDGGAAYYRFAEVVDEVQRPA